MDITQQELELIIKQVLEEIRGDPHEQRSGSGVSVPVGTRGIFENPPDALEAGYLAQKTYMRDFGISEREVVINALRKDLTLHIEEMAKTVYEETGIGVFKDKILKHQLVIDGTPGTEILKTEAASGSEGLTLMEYAPFGLIGAVTPVTNPSETIINNTISMLAGGNGVVFNPHPSAVESSGLAINLIHDSLKKSGAPENLVTMIASPTMETLKAITSSPHIRLILGTGGMGMVRALLSSGKKTIGAGAGNPPVIVDETADLALAAKRIYEGASFDNNLLCIAEKEVFTRDKITDELVREFQKNGAFLLNHEETERVTSLVLQYGDDGEYHPKKEWVGKDASLILDAVEIVAPRGGETKLIIARTEMGHPLVMTEQMLPVLPIVSCSSFEEASDFAYQAERGNRHTASIFSGDIGRITSFSKKIEATVFVVNNFTLAGVGFGGEGFATMTIAGPTGEGVTSALTFTRRRRGVLANGALRLV
jgi:propionaldehyde dehydrogenase